MDSINAMLNLSRPRIMGILNLTPDSFSDGGQLYAGAELDMDLVLRRVEQMLAEGADIIDLGGESTRPGAGAVSVQQEFDRVVPVVEAINLRFETPVSVDTSSPEVISASAAAGAAMINDVRALRRPGALIAAAATGFPVCLMHMAGEPDTMQQQPAYGDVVSDVIRFLMDRVSACEAAGISRQQILLDPGFGFGKTLAHNLALFRALPQLANLGLPLLVGVSRKSMIGAMLGREVDDRIFGSVALALLAVQRGARIIRVHDVAATVDVLRTLAEIEKDNNQ